MNDVKNFPIDIWNCEIIEQIYNDRSNYKLIDLDDSKENCYIFFSSNNLYYPNNYLEFKKKIIDADRYEWLRIARSKQANITSGRLIFIRDVYKRFYISGINGSINTQDKILSLLQELTNGYKNITTIGSSAGGYAAMLFGIRLNAAKCISFSGQVSIEKTVANFHRKVNSDQVSQRIYSDLKPLLLANSVCDIFYFYPQKHTQDLEIYNSISCISHIYGFGFNQKNHAASVIDENKAFIINWSKKQFLLLHNKYENKIINMFTFFFSTVPIKWWVYCGYKELKHYIQRKIRKS